MANSKYNIGTCKNLALERKGLCLSTEYQNPRQKLLWECDKGHKWEACFYSIYNKGSWCKICAGLKKLTIEDAIEEASKRNGKCLSTPNQLINAHSKLIWECDKGHKWKASLNQLRSSKSWCSQCHQRSLTIEDAQNWAKEKNGQCLSIEYIPNKKLLWECFKGHKWYARIDIIRAKTWCSECHRLGRFGKSSWSKGKNKNNSKIIKEWSLRRKGCTVWNTGKTKFDDKRIEKMGDARRGKTKETGDLLAIRVSERMKFNNPMKNMEIRLKAHQGHIISPNKPEKLIISKNYPNLEFTGNHSFWVNFKDKTHKNPDFVVRPFRKNKKVIEIWGEYWHRNENPLILKQKYNEVGVDCLILPYQTIVANQFDKIIREFII